MNPSTQSLCLLFSSARAATLLCKKWLAKFDYLPDAFVVEGPLAGGHLGFKPQQIDDPDFALEKIVPEVIEAVKPYEQKKNSASRLLRPAGSTPAKIFARFCRWAQQASKWGLVCVQRTNAMLIWPSNRHILTQKKEMRLLLQVLSGCLAELFAINFLMM
jgi:hypothetical protein